MWNDCNKNCQNTTFVNTSNCILTFLQHLYNYLYLYLFIAYCSEPIPVQPIQATNVTVETLDAPGQKVGLNIAKPNPKTMFLICR